MSLKFLYKKGFHTARLDIQDKVWQAEQKRDEEARKTAELRRQIEDERAVLELRAQMGGGGPSADTGLEWMYAGVRKSAAEKQDEAEAFLTGKKAVGESEGKAAKVATGADFDATKLSSKRLVAVTGGRAAAVEALAKVGSGNGPSLSTPSSSSSSSSSTLTSLHTNIPRSEAFAVRQADPLVAMTEAEARRKQLLLSDPRVLEKIKEKLLEEQRLKKQQLESQHQRFSPSTEQIDKSITSNSSATSRSEIIATSLNVSSVDASGGGAAASGGAGEDDKERSQDESRHRHRHHHRRHHHHHRRHRSEEKVDGEESSKHRHHHHRRRHHRDDDTERSRSRSRSRSMDDSSSRKRLREEKEEDEADLLTKKEESSQLPIVSAPEVRVKKSRWDNPNYKLDSATIEKSPILEEVKKEMANEEGDIAANKDFFIINKELNEQDDEAEIELDMGNDNRASKPLTNSSLQFGLTGGSKKKEGVNHLGIPDHIAKEREALFRAKQFESRRGRGRS